MCVCGGEGVRVKGGVFVMMLEVFGNTVVTHIRYKSTDLFMPSDWESDSGGPLECDADLCICVGAAGVGKLAKHLWRCKETFIRGEDMKEFAKPQRETEGFWLSPGILLCTLLKEQGDQRWAGDTLLGLLTPIEQGGAKGDI